MPEVNDDHTPEPPRDDTHGWVSGSSGYQCDACAQDVHCFGPRCTCCNRGTEDDDVELCPLAKVPCEENIFGLCKTCGRDLSGNPDA